MAEKEKNLNNHFLLMINPNQLLVKKFRGIRSNIMFSRAKDEIVSIIVTSENRQQVRVLSQLISQRLMLKLGIGL